MALSVTIELSDYQSSFIRELLEENVGFLIIGGMAIRAHGLERSTHDLDLFLDRSRENIDRLLPVITKRFRNVPPKLCKEWLCLPDRRVALPCEQASEIDVLTSVGALDYSATFAGRIEINNKGFLIPVIGLRELMYSKFISADRNEHSGAIERDIRDILDLLQVWEQRNNQPFNGDVLGINDC